MRLFGAMVMIAALCACAPTWQRVDPSVSPAVYVDTSATARYRQWSRTMVKVEDGATEVRHAVEFDCLMKTYRFQESTTLVNGKVQSSRFDQQYVRISADATPGFASALRVACDVQEDPWLRFNQHGERSR